MRTPAFEIIGIARAKNAPLVVDRYLQSPRKYDPALLAFVNEGNFPRIRPGLVAFLKHLQAAAEETFSNLSIGNRAFADLHQFLSRIKRLAWSLRFKSKEFGETNRNTIQNPLQRADRSVCGV